MKVLMIIPSLGSGGAERVLSGLANDWTVKNKCKIELVILMNSEDFYQINSKIKIHRLNYNPGGIFKIIKLLILLFKLRLLIKAIKPDICLSFIKESNILTILATRWLKFKVIISERNSPLAPISSLYKTIRKYLYTRADGLIVQTQEYKDFVLREIGFVNQEIIPNPVRNIHCLNENREKIIINIGRLIPVKGQSYLLEAFARCKNADDWSLVILGEGILKQDLIAQAKKLGIDQRVIFVGATKEVDQWLCRSSIFAFTSTSEGFPNALAEAMSASLPCISFNCVTGPKELIQDNINGFLIKVGDINNLVIRLEALIDSEQLRYSLGLNAKKTTELLEFNSISERYFSFLLKVNNLGK